MTIDPLLADIVARVDTGELARRMADVFRAEIDSYRRMPAEVVRGQIADISRYNVEVFFGSLISGDPPQDGDLRPFRESARRRAAEGLPLEDLLHAYRIGGRLGWEALVAAAEEGEQAVLLPTVARLMDYVDRVSDAVTETYQDERQQLLSVEERRLSELFAALVGGEPLDAAVRAAAEELGFPVTDRYRPFAAVHAEGPAFAQAQLAATLRARGVLAVSEGERIVGLLPADADRAALGERPGLVALGAPTARPDLAAALEDARLLLDVGRALGKSGEIAADAFLAELLLKRSPDVAAAVRRVVLSPLEDYASRRSGDLLETLEVFVSVDCDRRQAAEQLHIHPNTLDYRLRRVEELTQLRLGRPDDLVLVALALKQRRLGA